MNAWRRISRYFLYSLLFAAFAAAWVAVTVLKAPDPQMPEDELEAFEASLSEDAADLLARRNDALNELVSNVPTQIPSSRSQVNGILASAGFETARRRISGALNGEIGGILTQTRACELNRSPALDEILDTADRFFWDSVAEQTASVEPVLRDSMERQADAHIRMVGYRVLMETLNRDIIRYRILESLPLHEYKLDIYRDEFNTAKNLLGLQRGATAADIEEIKSGVESRYSDLLAGLIGEFSARLADVDGTQPEADALSLILDDIRTRIAGFKSIRFTNEIEQPSAAPEIAAMAWLSGEKTRGENFASAASGNGGI